jgi:hypothetical protein
MFIRLGFLVWGNFKLIFLTFLSLKKLWWDVKSIFFRSVGILEALKIENSHMKAKIWSCPNIDMGLFMVANCSLIPKMYKFCCLEVNFECYRLILIKIWRNLKISYILTLFEWLKLTFKQQNSYIFGISEQFAIRKRTFICEFSIFMALRLPTNLWKKIKHVEIDFTSYTAWIKCCQA